LQATSVINSAPNRQSIAIALEKLYSVEFQAALSHTRNPYGEGGASEKVVEIIKSYKIDGIVKKVFYDLPVR
jgi:GDP/UDP-N,N'-diacetylbacillosamine 2-epimerase (hydrolysing)